MKTRVCLKYFLSNCSLSRQNFSLKKFIILKKLGLKNFVIFSPKSRSNCHERELSYISGKVYLEPQYIQNPGILKAHVIFRTLSNIYNGRFWKKKTYLPSELLSFRPQNFSRKIFPKNPALKKNIYIFSKGRFSYIFSRKSPHIFWSKLEKVYPKKIFYLFS